jgi:hypothetical protein
MTSSQLEPQREGNSKQNLEAMAALSEQTGVDALLNKIHITGSSIPTNNNDSDEGQCLCK